MPPRKRWFLSSYNVRRERDQFRCIFANALGIARTPAILDPHVAPDDPAQFLQPLKERREAGLIFRIVRRLGHEHADTPDAIRLLCAHGLRPSGCGAAKQSDKFAPFPSNMWLLPLR